MNRRWKPLVIALLFGIAWSGLAGTARAGIGDSQGLSPFWEWRTIETANFRVTFPAELGEIANRTANYLEKAHSILSPRLQWTAHYKAPVLVLDNQDAANGLTSPSGRFGMILFATPPDNWFSTAYYDDWLWLLVVHEYTHFLNMDTTRGIWQGLRYLFGDVLLPNSIWPPWMLEGLAVYMETRFTRSGRGRSPFYEMILRSATEEGMLDDPAFATLDRINGPNPYYPGGESDYLFGYELMNQVARAGGAEILGEMSSRSGDRVPFFINGNLENITGKTWPRIWEEWVAETRARCEAELRRIRSRALTPVRRLTDGGFQTLGPSVSPDGKWLAFTRESLDERMSLVLAPLQGDGTIGQPRELTEKILGASLAFTPDSRALIFSSQMRRDQYLFWSDLSVYDRERDESYELTRRLRARDPDVSPDGKWVAFTRTEAGRTGLSLAALIWNGERYSLGPIQGLFTPDLLDRVSTPKFSPDGARIVFTLHRNGEPGEDLAEFDRAMGVTRLLLSNGRYNRYPAFDRASGDLHFISDQSGVDNLFHYRPDGRSEQITNVTTGLAFPVFAPDGSVYASSFRFTGWDLARVTPATMPYPTADLTLPPRPAPLNEQDPEQLPPVDLQSHVSRPYSLWPSILPRQWFPFPAVQVGSYSTYMGGQLLGFDQLDLHRYVLGGAYDFNTRNADWLFVYSNRQLGPTFTVSADHTTSEIQKLGQGAGLLRYTRRLRFAASVGYPLLFTFSALTPSVTFNTERSFLFVPGANPDNGDLVSQNDPLATLDLVLAYTSAERSRLAITSEKGRSTLLATRAFLNIAPDAWKAFASDEEYLRVWEHSVLVPSVKAAWSSRPVGYTSSPNVVVQGRYSRDFFDRSLDNLDQLTIRGYPGQLLFSKAAAVFGLDYRIPLIQIFRGWSTNPIFLNSLYAFTFAEATWLPSPVLGAAMSSLLPSIGGGVRLNATALIRLPVILAAEFHQGLSGDSGGSGDLLFQAYVPFFTF